ncbi:MAG TPA: hypothetical protein VGT08_04515 [Terracidiphilus sp.]|nr:hypothetical protein [Terracidiphilus sp.]
MRGKKQPSGEMVQGTLDMLILRTFAMGPAHGHTIAHVIEHTLENVLEVEQGSLYPAAPAGGSQVVGSLLGCERKQPQGEVLQTDRNGARMSGGSCRHYSPGCDSSVVRL